MVGCRCCGVRDVGTGTRAVLGCCGPLAGAASLDYNDTKLACANQENNLNPFSILKEICLHGSGSSANSGRRSRFTAVIIRNRHNQHG